MDAPRCTPPARPSVPRRTPSLRSRPLSSLRRPLTPTSSRARNSRPELRSPCLVHRPRARPVHRRDAVYWARGCCGAGTRARCFARSHTVCGRQALAHRPLHGVRSFERSEETHRVEPLEVRKVLGDRGGDHRGRQEGVRRVDQAWFTSRRRRRRQTPSEVEVVANSSE